MRLLVRNSQHETMAISEAPPDMTAAPPAQSCHNGRIAFLPRIERVDAPRLPRRSGVLFSWIIPAYNAGQWLDAAIGSALTQEGLAAEELEVLVVDDGSDDDTPQVIARWADADSRVVGLRHSVNCGVAAARNTAIAAASGQYVSYLDADDVAPPWRARTAMRLLAETGAHLLYGDEEVFNSDVGTRSPGAPSQPPEMVLAGGHCSFRTGTVTALRQWHHDSGVWLDERLAVAEDYELLVAALAAGARVLQIPDVMLWRRSHGASLRGRGDWRLARAYTRLKHARWLQANARCVMVYEQGETEAVRAALESVENECRMVRVMLMGKQAMEGGTAAQEHSATSASPKFVSSIAEMNSILAKNTGPLAVTAEGQVVHPPQVAVEALADPSIGAVVLRPGDDDGKLTGIIGLETIASLALRPRTALAVGGFDDDYETLAAALTDMGVRLLAAHYRLACLACPQAPPDVPPFTAADDQRFFEAHRARPQKLFAAWRPPELSVVLLQPQADVVGALHQAVPSAEIVVVGAAADGAGAYLEGLKRGPGADANLGISRCTGRAVAFIADGGGIAALPGLLDEMCDGDLDCIASTGAIIVDKTALVKAGAWLPASQAPAPAAVAARMERMGLKVRRLPGIEREAPAWPQQWPPRHQPRREAGPDPQHPAWHGFPGPAYPPAAGGPLRVICHLFAASGEGLEGFAEYLAAAMPSTQVEWLFTVEEAREGAGAALAQHGEVRLLSDDPRQKSWDFLRAVHDFRPHLVHASREGGAVMAQRLGLPCLVTVHGLQGGAHYGADFADYAVGVSPAARSDTDATVISGIRPVPFPKRRMSKQVVFIGRLDIERNPELYLDVLQQVPEARGLIIGAANRRHFDAEAEIARRDLGERVCYAGRLPAGEARGLAAESDVIMSCCRAGESFGLATAEAMSAGVIPLVAGGPGYQAEMVGQWGTVAEGNVESMARALKALLADEGREARRRPMARAVAERYGVARMAAEYYDLYCSLLMPPLDIVVVAHNQLPLTVACLNHYRAHTWVPHNLILVDNGSDDGTHDFFRRVRDEYDVAHGPGRVEVIRLPENLGAPHGRNAGYRKGTAPFISLLDNDMMVPPGWAGPLMRALLLCPDAAGCAAAFETGGGGDGRVADAGHSGTTCILRRSALCSVEEPGQRGLLYVEPFASLQGRADTDLNCRIAEAGWRFLHHGGIVCHHVGGMLRTADSQGMTRRFADTGGFERGQRLFDEKWVDWGVRNPQWRHHGGGR